MVIPWLADVLRAEGLVVVEHAGWKTRKALGSWHPQYGIVHATAAPVQQSDEVQVRIVRDGREGLPGPIANACVDRRGRWHVLAVGRCNTTLTGTAGPYRGIGNTGALGVEACNNNINEPWLQLQYDSYAVGWAAICRRLGWKAERLRGHKEHTPGHKTDPTFDMRAFRQLVQHLIEHPRAVEDDMYTEADRLRDEQTHAIVRAQRWGWDTDRAGFIKAAGDNGARSAAIWDQGGGMGENLAARNLKALLERPAVQLTDEQVQQFANTVADAVVTQMAGTVLTVEDVAAAVRTLLGDLKLRAEVA